MVAHRRLGYRAVVVDADAVYRDTDAWCEVTEGQGARSEPWYRVLPDGAAHEAYLPERSLRADPHGERIRHPLLWFYFSDFRDGAYHLTKAAN